MAHISEKSHEEIDISVKILQTEKRKRECKNSVYKVWLDIYHHQLLKSYEKLTGRSFI